MHRRDHLHPSSTARSMSTSTKKTTDSSPTTLFPLLQIPPSNKRVCHDQNSPKRLLVKRERKRPRTREHAAPDEFQQLFHPSDCHARVRNPSTVVSSRQGLFTVRVFSNRLTILLLLLPCVTACSGGCRGNIDAAQHCCPRAGFSLKLGWCRRLWRQRRGGSR